MARRKVDQPSSAKKKSKPNTAADVPNTSDEEDDVRTKFPKGPRSKAVRQGLRNPSCSRHFFIGDETGLGQKIVVFVFNSDVSGDKAFQEDFNMSFQVWANETDDTGTGNCKTLVAVYKPCLSDAVTDMKMKWRMHHALADDDESCGIWDRIVRLSRQCYETDLKGILFKKGSLRSTTEANDMFEQAMQVSLFFYSSYFCL